MLKLLLCSVFLHAVFIKCEPGDGFGTSYLKNSRLCHQWSCIHKKLGLTEDGIPPRDVYARKLKEFLPKGPWQSVVDNVLHRCYEDRPRRYTGTCPGQDLLHCTVDQMIQFCPQSSLRKADACAPVESLAGFQYMFSQSRYNDLEKNLRNEHRPAWFLKNYFSSNCCNLPPLFEPGVPEECGFSAFISYHVHQPNNGPMAAGHYPKIIEPTSTPKSTNELKIVDLSHVEPEKVQRPANQVTQYHYKLNFTTGPFLYKSPDPLDCCDLSGFIQPSWRSECGFQMSWGKDSRLAIKNNTLQVATTAAPTTVRPGKTNDVKVVPESCEKSSCVFKKLNILSANGTVDLDSFSKLLDNMTVDHTSWVKAKARVVTKCLTTPLRAYFDECEINKVLACTFDVLSENCPHAKKQDPCRHSTILKEDITCQISSSKFRPKNRRQFCGIPNLVNHEVLTECGINSLTRMEYVPDPVTAKPNTHWWIKSKFVCKGSTDSTKCLLNKMGVLNKYGFLDYFKMKERIRSFTGQDVVWSSLTDVYLNTFTSIPMYGEECSTPKKLLNVLDAMLMTCPMSKRKPSLQCNRILTDMASTPANKNISPEKYQQIRKHFEHVYNIPTSKPPVFPSWQTAINALAHKQPSVHKNPTYDFGILNSKDAPKVEVIDVKPTTTKQPLVLLPVYLTMRFNGRNTTYLAPIRDGILRHAPVYPPVPNIP